MYTMFCRTSFRFPRAFKPLHNMEACFRNNPVYFAQQANNNKENEENPFMKKYADKIQALQSTCPEEYRKRAEKLKSSRRSDNFSTTKHISNPKNSISEPYKSQTPPVYSRQKKTLNDIMKLDLLKDKSKEEIEMIWKQYHKDKPGLYAILPSESFQKILTKSVEYPTFLLPLPKAEGYEFIMCQFTMNSCYFTQLINFQTHKENAPVCLTVTYYSELQEDKGIVLMRGEFDENTMKPHEAQCLLNQLQLYYGGICSRKERLLWLFNKQPTEFKHMDLVSELELGV